MTTWHRESRSVHEPGARPRSAAPPSRTRGRGPGSRPEAPPLPPGLFTHTNISCCVWLLNRDKSPHRGWGQRDRRGQVLFIHAREAYELVGKSRQRRLAPGGVEKILRTLAAWRGTAADSGGREADYEDEPGWCRSSSAQEIADREHDLLPTSYAGVEAVEEGVAARLQVERLTRELYAKFDEAHVLERDLRRALDS
ncbi:N-6 DNA methylase, partial [Streptomyces sp. MCAF7]